MLDTLERLAHDLAAPSAVWLTHGTDGTHVEHSRHYTGEALDVRVHNFVDEPSVRAFADTLAQTLGADYTVLVEDAGTENAHIHAQVRKGVHIPE